MSSPSVALADGALEIDPFSGWETVPE